MTPLTIREASDEYDRTGEPQPIRSGRCEKIVRGGTGTYGAGRYCGKGGRWLVGHQIRCGQHKED